MGVIKIEIPGSFEVKIKAKNINDAVKQLKKLQKEELLKLVGTVEDSKDWKATKKDLENEMYGFSR